ncbi:serine protease [Aphelenchoides avenae]|nr:serine protease [Aphelenchus avenae]
MLACLVTALVAVTLTHAEDDYDCGRVNIPSASRVVEGRPIHDGDFPFLAYIYIAKNEPSFPKLCTGSIISHRHILTAGHCAFEGSNTTVVYGTSNHTGQVPKLVKKLKKHPDFTEEDANNFGIPDIALIEVAEPIVFNDNTGRVCLPKKYAETEASQATVIGWGFDADKNERPPTVAERNEVLLYASEMCDQPSIAPNFNKTFTICAGGHHTGTENGDSGGPLVVDAKGRYFQIGITAFGRTVPDEKDGDYDVAGYMRVASFCDFIEKETAGEAKCLDAENQPPLKI